MYFPAHTEMTTVLVPQCLQRDFADPGLAEPVRSSFVAAARGRIQAAQVLAARPGQPTGEPLTSAGGMHGFVPR